MDFIEVIILLIVCYFVGTYREKSHYKSIKKREVMLFRQPYISFAKHLKTSKKIKRCCLVSSSVCIGCDYFKMAVASLKNIFGGNVSVYESVLDRARREAILRIREQAVKYNANIVLNIKLETVMLIDKNKESPKACVIAYGTAVQYE